MGGLFRNAASLKPHDRHKPAGRLAYFVNIFDDRVDRTSLGTQSQGFSTRDWRLEMMMGRWTSWITTMALVVGFGTGCSDNDDSVLDGSGADGENGEDLFNDPGVDTEEQQCPGVEVAFTQRVPFIMVLVDQSGSMESNFGNGTRWSVMREALLDEDSGIIRTLHNDVRMGLALYTSEDGYAGGQCPMINKIDAEFGNYDAIRSLYDAAEPVEDTPTGESLLAVAEQLEKVYVNNATPKAIVLATDGHPDTCEQPDPQNGQEKSLNAARAAFDMGIRTYAISVGDEIGEDHLQDLANAGAGIDGGAGNNAKFYRALNNGELYEAFSDIINGVRDCVFNLDGEVVEGYEDQGTVRIDGISIPKDDPNGWRLNNPKQVELVGEACTLIQEGDHNLDIDFPCGGYEAPPVY